MGDALELAVRQRSTSYQAELLRLRGELLLGRGDAPDEAESALLEAVGRCEPSGGTRPGASGGDDARPALARARTCPRGPHDACAPYEWFEEGAETPDPRAAAALLEELERRSEGVVRRPVRQRRAGGVLVAVRAPARPPVRYAEGSGLNIAYQVTGVGPIDLVLVSGFVSHLELDWVEPRHARFLDRLSSFSRLIRFDKRGTGLSDRPSGLPDLETRMDDVRAVMDAAGIERAVLLGYSEGGPMSALFAATYPERVSALVLYGTYARRTRAQDHPGLRRRTSASPMPTRSSASGAGRPTCARCARTPTRRWPNGGASGPARRRAPAPRAI